MPESPEYLTRTRIREILESQGLSPSRALGQNYLCDPAMINKIVRLSGVGPGDRVVEIGPGLGSLTVGLVRAGVDLVVIELDRFLIEPLQDTIGDHEVVVHNADAMEFDYSGVHGGKEWTLVANLPYNVSAPLLLDLLRDVPAMRSALVLVQKEVGERLAAGPGSKTFGIPSVLVSYWGEAKVMANVPAQLFFPKPNVESVLVKVDRVDPGSDRCDFNKLAQLVRAGFGQRRKMVRRSLSAFLTIDQIEAAGVAQTCRAEELSLDDWSALVEVSQASV